MDDIIIRQPKINEFNTWSEIYQKYLHFYKTSLTKNQLEKVWHWLFEPEKHKLFCYFALLDNKIIGLAHFRVFARPIKASKGIYLDDLIVLPEFHGKGVGKLLIKKIEAYAKANQISLVRWITAHDNSQAMHLYDSIAVKTNWVTYDSAIH